MMSAVSDKMRTLPRRRATAAAGVVTLLKSYCGAYCAALDVAAATHDDRFGWMQPTLVRMATPTTDRHRLHVAVATASCHRIDPSTKCRHRPRPYRCMAFRWHCCRWTSSFRRPAVSSADFGPVSTVSVCSAWRNGPFVGRLRRQRTCHCWDCWPCCASHRRWNCCVTKSQRH